jgi:hypothetical protein
VVHFNGLNNHMHTTAYVAREDCESHWVYGDITELPLRAENTSLEDLLKIVRSDLGPDSVIELDQEVVLSLKCLPCNTSEELIRPMSEISFEAAHCPNCGNMREVTMEHLITGEENFLHHTLASVGIPPLHIIRANNGMEYRFYELTGDLPETLTFTHFKDAVPDDSPPLSERIKIGEAVEVEEAGEKPTRPRIKLRD